MTNPEKKTYDVISYGRSSIDLYSQKVGARFEEIPGFHAFVGGSPLNIAVGCSRLGLKASLLSGVGKDKVGDFILNFLKNEKVCTENVRQIEGARSSAVILGIEPPDRFPLVYYRDNCADSQINIDQVLKAGIERSRLLEISGTALNIEPTRSAAFLAVEIARKNEVPVLLDLDFRADQWHDIRAFGVTVRSCMRNVNIVLGTEEEILAIAQMRDVSDKVLRAIANVRRFRTSKTVVTSLLHNPKTPVGVSLGLGLPNLTDRDLQRLARDRNIPAAVSRAAQQILERRSKGPITKK